MRASSVAPVSLVHFAWGKPTVLLQRLSNSVNQLQLALIAIMLRSAKLVPTQCVSTLAWMLTAAILALLLLQVALKQCKLSLKI